MSNSDCVRRYDQAAHTWPHVINFNLFHVHLDMDSHLYTMGNLIWAPSFRGIQVQITSLSLSTFFSSPLISSSLPSLPLPFSLLLIFLCLQYRFIILRGISPSPSPTLTTSSNPLPHNMVSRSITSITFKIYYIF